MRETQLKGSTYTANYGGPLVHSALLRTALSAEDRRTSAEDLRSNAEGVWKSPQ